MATADMGRGQKVGRLSSEWFNCPADESYLSLAEPMTSVQRLGPTQPDPNRGTEAIRLEANRDETERLHSLSLAPGTRLADIFELSAASSRAACWCKSAIRPDLAPR